MRPSRNADDADECVSVALHLYGLRCDASAEGGRLLRVLFVWRCEVPTHSGRRLLRFIRVAPFAKIIPASSTDDEVSRRPCRRGRAVLTGDAAHIHMPIGSQGMNIGIGDANNLARKRRAVLAGRAPDALL